MIYSLTVYFITPRQKYNLLINIVRNGLNIISSIKFRAALKHLDLIKEFFSSGLSEDRGGNPNTFKEGTKISYRHTILKRKRKRR